MRGQSQNVQKPKNAKKSTVRSAVGGSSAGAGAVSSPGLNASKCEQRDLPACLACGTLVTDHTLALQCDKCKAGSAWKCIDCLGIPKDIYTALLDCKDLCWLCPLCEPSIQVQVSDSRDDRMVSLLDRMMDKLVSFEHQFNSKVSCLTDIQMKVHEFERTTDFIDSRISEIENKLTVLSSKSVGGEIDSRVQVLESKVSALEKSLQSMASSQSTRHVDGNDITDTEQNERDKRRNNVILYRVPESNSAVPDERNCADLAFVHDFCNDALKVTIASGDIERMFRIGQKADDKTRPLLVRFANEAKKAAVFSHLKELKTAAEHFKGVSVAHDLTPLQREQVKRVYQEAKERLNTQQDPESGNVRILVVGQTSRPRAVMIKGQKKQDA